MRTPVLTVGLSVIPLGIAGTYQSWIDPPITEIVCQEYRELRVASSSDVVGTVNVYCSILAPGSREICHTFPMILDPVTALFTAQAIVPLTGIRWISVEYVNGAGAQTRFSLYAYLI